jgi:hypothetical protein
VSPCAGIGWIQATLQRQTCRPEYGCAESWLVAGGRPRVTPLACVPTRGRVRGAFCSAVLGAVALLALGTAGAATSSPKAVLEGQLPTAAELGPKWSVESPPSFTTDGHGVAGAHCKQSVGGAELTAYFDSTGTGQYLEVRLISSSMAERIFSLMKRSIASGCYFTSQPIPHVPAGTKSTKISYRPAHTVSGGLRQVRIQGKSRNHPVIYNLLYFFQKGSTVALISEDGVGHSDVSIVRVAASKLR